MMNLLHCFSIQGAMYSIYLYKDVSLDFYKPPPLPFFHSGFCELTPPQSQGHKSRHQIFLEDVLNVDYKSGLWKKATINGFPFSPLLNSYQSKDDPSLLPRDHSWAPKCLVCCGTPF